MGNKKRELKKERHERDKKKHAQKKEKQAQAIIAANEKPKTAMGQYMHKKNKENGND